MTTSTADPDRQHALRALAADLGVELEYWDVQGNLHEAGVDALLGVLTAMGHPAHELADVDHLRDEHDRRVADQVVEPVLVADVGADLVFDVRLPAARRPGVIDVRVVAEDGAGELVVACSIGEATGEVGLPGGRPVVEHRVRVAWSQLESLAPGYHQLEVHGATDEPAVAHLILAPTRVPSFAATDRVWGIFAPAYVFPGGTGIGAHVGDLGQLAERLDGHGAKLVGTLPLLASWLDEPFEPSPYAPVSRSFWNELFVDLQALPELGAVAEVGASLDGLRTIGHAANVKSRLFDYRHQYGYVHGVLERVIGALDHWPDRLRADFETWRSARPDVARYAAFRAYARQAGTGWHQWPERARGGDLAPSDVDAGAVAFHTYAQYAMSRQLDALAGSLRSRDQRLYLDLPIGVGGDGFDTWVDPQAYAWGAGTGAPPDEFFTEGQDWGFPPMRPDETRTSGHRSFAAVLRHHLRVCGVLRLDHVMAFHRLYWVPQGAGARDGVYVRYPSRELYAVLAVEAHRHDAVIVGENLGTVPPEVTAAMTRHGLLGMHVLEFNQPDWAGAEPVAADGDQLSSFGTHDTPTFAGWVHGFDIDQRHELQLLSDDQAIAERVRRSQQVDNLRGFLRARGYPVDAPARAGREEVDRALFESVVRFLGDSDAPAVLLSIDDLWLEPNPQNIPGTPVDRPNWVQRSPSTLDELLADDGVVSILRAMQDCRLGSHLRARGASPS